MKQTKKFAALLLALAMVLALAACGGEPAENDPPAPEAETPSAAPETEPAETPEETPIAPAEPEFTQYSVGETVQLEGAPVEITTTGFVQDLDYLHGNYSFFDHNGGDYYFWLAGTITNTGTETIEEMYMSSATKVSIIFDDTYTYNGRFWMNTDVGPMSTTDICLWADVPPAMLENYESITVRFAYMEGFSHENNPSSDDFEAYDYRCEFVSDGGGSSSPDLTPVDAALAAEINAKLQGTWEYDAPAGNTTAHYTIVFSGSNVSVSSELVGQTISNSGTFEICNDVILVNYVTGIKAAMDYTYENGELNLYPIYGL